MRETIYDQLRRWGFKPIGANGQPVADKYCMEKDCNQAPLHADGLCEVHHHQRIVNAMNAAALRNDSRGAS